MKLYLKQIALITFLATATFAQLMSSHAPTVNVPNASTDTVALHAVGQPIVRVNGAVLTDADLVREMYTIFPYARQHNGVPKAMEADIRTGAFKMIVFEELVYQEAKRRQMTIPPAQLDRAVAQFRSQFSTPQEYRQFVKTEFQGNSQLVRARIERSLLIDKLLKLEVGNKSQVTLAEEKAYYRQHLDRFAVPESFVFQSISILPPQNATPAQVKEARKRAQDTLLQARNTQNYEEFGLLAEKMSDDDFRVMMGDHKAADRSKLPPVIVNAFASMKPGDVSDVIEFDKNTYTIVRLNEHIPAGTQDFELVKNELRARLLKNKSDALRGALSAKLSKNAKIEKL
jgi:hypothetical protein